MLTRLSHSLSRVNRIRRHEKIAPSVLAAILVQPFRRQNQCRRLFQGPFAAEASQWYQALLRTARRMEPALLRTKNVLSSLPFWQSRAMTGGIGRVQMSDVNMRKIILIREGTPLPSTLSMKSEAFLPGWRVVKNLDRQGLGRGIAAANLKFAYLTGEIRASVVGSQGLPGLRKAAARALASQERQQFTFNALEFTRVVSKRFLGIPVMSVGAHARCIQGGTGLTAPRILS
jgi:hypothetical protein